MINVNEKNYELLNSTLYIKVELVSKLQNYRIEMQ